MQSFLNDAQYQYISKKFSSYKTSQINKKNSSEQLEIKGDVQKISLYIYTVCVNKLEYFHAWLIKERKIALFVPLQALLPQYTYYIYTQTSDIAFHATNREYILLYIFSYNTHVYSYCAIYILKKKVINARVTHSSKKKRLW